MNVNLFVVYGKTTKRKLVPRLPAVLGRGRTADIKVIHPLISRQHCQLFENDGLLMLRDLASLNGTMVGGKRIELAPLLPGGEFTIGPLTFQVMYAHDGGMDSVPETRFVPEGAAAVEAGPPHAMLQEPTFDTNDPWSDGVVEESESGEVAMPDLMVLADAEVEEVFPAPPASVRHYPTAPQRPPVAMEPPTASLATEEVLEDPMEFDSSLQSGGHHVKPPFGRPPIQHRDRDEDDPEIGNFLEGLK
jgi:pSer/pThr/pTyr-binding forkhead associated (FHA) protein